MSQRWQGSCDRTVKSCDLIGPLYDLQTFERKYTDITRMRGARWMLNRAKTRPIMYVRACALAN